MVETSRAVRLMHECPKVKLVLACWALGLNAGCAAGSKAPGVAPSPGAPAETPKPTPALPSASASAAIPESSPAAAAPAPLELRFERELAAKVSSIALGEGSRIAVLADQPYAGDAGGLRPLPLPHALAQKADEHDELGIYFGRDNEPRIMGSRRSPSSEESIYWRHSNGVWKDGREEIGPLGGTTRGALWGVLGSADPELVCRAGSLCIIKRSSGWTIAPAGAEPRRVELLGGTLWGLDANGLANIDARGWSVVMPAPAWSKPRAFWATSGEAWVATERTLCHFHAGAWSEEPSPISAPNAMWGQGPSSIWLVGQGGAAHFDGHVWRPLSLAGPLSAVSGRGESELWLGGEAGLFRLSL